MIVKIILVVLSLAILTTSTDFQVQQCADTLFQLPREFFSGESMRTYICYCYKISHVDPTIEKCAEERLKEPKGNYKVALTKLLATIMCTAARDEESYQVEFNPEPFSLSKSNNENGGVGGANGSTTPSTVSFEILDDIWPVHEVGFNFIEGLHENDCADRMVSELNETGTNVTYQYQDLIKWCLKRFAFPILLMKNEQCSTLLGTDPVSCGQALLDTLPDLTSKWGWQLLDAVDWCYTYLIFDAEDLNEVQTTSQVLTTVMLEETSKVPEQSDSEEYNFHDQVVISTAQDTTLGVVGVMTSSDLTTESAGVQVLSTVNEVENGGNSDESNERPLPQVQEPHGKTIDPLPEQNQKLSDSDTAYEPLSPQILKKCITRLTSMIRNDEKMFKTMNKWNMQDIREWCVARYSQTTPNSTVDAGNGQNYWVIAACVISGLTFCLVLCFIFQQLISKRKIILLKKVPVPPHVLNVPNLTENNCNQETDKIELII